MKRISSMLLAVGIAFSLSASANAAVLTFDDAIVGATSYSFDGDGDMINDVLISTTDPLGFNTVGPGPNMSYINEPGLEGTTLLNPDLMVNFLSGATGSLSFGYAVSSPGTTLTFSVYDSSNTLLASIFSTPSYTPTSMGFSSFEEALVSLTFTGTASYALFDYSTSGRYILDNFSGTFGSAGTPTPTPEPGTLLLLGSGVLGLAAYRKLRRKA